MGQRLLDLRVGLSVILIWVAINIVLNSAVSSQASPSFSDAVADFRSHFPPFPLPRSQSIMPLSDIAIVMVDTRDLLTVLRDDAWDRNGPGDAFWYGYITTAANREYACHVRA